ncbi:MAG: thermonuclease family protein [Tannerella sp.]|jgi:endonuclease YncB( thermonuclease family)|nr:thermonuclease family protein [Tannerella sp.]
MKRLIPFLLCLLPLVSFAQETLTGKVVKVSDGDTFILLDGSNSQTRIRLYGIDCPERGQDFGTAATRKTAGLIAGKQVTVHVYDTDRYKRKVGIVIVDGMNVNEELLKAGFAWNYIRYNKLFAERFAGLEQEARIAKRGLWVQKAIAPWEFRKR